MSEWKLKKIGEVADLFQGLAINVKTKYLLVKDGPRLPLLRIKDLIENSEEYYIDYQNAPQKSLVNYGDLIFTRTGQVGYVFNNRKGVLHNNCFKIIPKNDNVLLSEFLYHFFNRENVRDYLESISAGSVQSDMNHSIFKLVEIPVPPIQEQRAIASLLSSLDDKIDLLHRQNQTLEQLAEALFRQWFVEEVNEEWEEGVLKDLFILQRGFDLPRQNRVEGPYPIYAASGESGGHIEPKVKAPGVTTGRSGVLGNVYYITDDFWPLNTSLYVKEFKRSTPLFAYFLLKTIDIKSFNAGSAVPTLNRNHIHEYPVLIPPVELIKQFGQTVNPMFQKIKSNQTQIRTLTALRDTLLPKLMSGEVRVN